jgi:hypothetical protein
VYSSEDIQSLSEYLMNKFIQKILLSLQPEHRLFLLALICFYKKLENKNDLTETELEFLIRGTCLQQQEFSIN